MPSRATAVERKNEGEGHRGQRLQVWLLLGEVLQHDAAGGGVPARIGDSVEPTPELAIQIIEVAERAAAKEVFPDVAERALDLCPLSLPLKGGHAFGKNR